MKKETTHDSTSAPDTTSPPAEPGTDTNAGTPEPVIDLVPARLKLKSILVPMDFSPQAQKALRYAITFAEQFGAALVLLTVVEPAVYPTEVGFVPVELENLYQAMEKSAREKLAELGKTQVPPGLLSQTLVRVGSPYREITETARELNVDLLVIATHGYTGLKHVFLGSTAERVIRHAPCPVLTVREREHDFA